MNYQEDLQKRYDALKHEYDLILKSNSMRITSPLREIRRFFLSPKSRCIIYLIQLLKLAKSCYQSLPLNQSRKQTIRKWFGLYFPKLLIASGADPMTVLGAGRVNPVSDLFNLSWLDFKVEDLNLRTSSKPQVSVIIPVYGNIDYTLNCLASIAKHQPDAPIEVIVVDDCSQDETVKLLGQLSSIKLIKNEINKGFIKSCNAGASVAKGKYLLFLNNDTQVTKGWLDELLMTFSNFDNVGLVGSKLIYPDGRLQEAGGIIWSDGSAWNFGRFQDPYAPIYSYARQVDYCSGASIMVPKKVFEKVGGFDEIYAPAYCEDSDLALKLRSMDYGVIYQPNSLVVHFEGVSCGTDTNQGVKAYQVTNTQKLFDRWKDFLSSNQAPGLDLDSAKDRGLKRRVLVLDHCLPTPDKDAGSVTAYNMLMLLKAMDFQITFIPEDNFLYDEKYTSMLQRLGIEVEYAPYTVSVAQHLKEHGDRYDLVFLFRPDVVFRHLSTVRRLCVNAKVIFETADIHFLRMQREAALTGNPAIADSAAEMKEKELNAIGNVDCSIIRSSHEHELIKELLPNSNIYLYPLILDICPEKQHWGQRKDIFFLGGYNHRPNVDAVKYFVEEIMPILRQRVDGIKFHIAGSSPTEEVKKLECNDVVVTGYVEDLKSFFSTKRLSVVPLRYGAGIKGKIGTSFAFGVPVVSTSIGAEGMGLSDGKHLLIADDPAAIVESIAAVYEDNVLWDKLSQNGQEFAEKNFGVGASYRVMYDILHSLGFDVNESYKNVRFFSNNRGKDHA